MPSACILAAVFGPTPWNFAIGSVATKASASSGRIANWPFGFAIVRCDLGEELVAGNSGRGREPDFLVDPRPDFLGGLPRCRDLFEIVGYVQIGFIERKRFD